MNSKIYSIVVAYNPDIKHLNESIKRLIEQTDKVIICNNSKDDIIFDNKDLIVFNFGENKGIAEAQNIGMHWAFDNDADFIIQLDQDSLIGERMVDSLINCYFELSKKNLNPGLIGPLEHDIKTKINNHKRIAKGVRVNKDIWRVQETISSGALIPKEVFLKVGDNNEKLFIDLVDIDFCWRVQKEGYGVFVCKNASLSHRLGNGKKKVLFNYYIDIHPPIRLYYQTRNLLFSFTFPHAPIIWKFYVFPRIIKSIFINPFFLDQPIIRLRYIFMGIRDAMLSKHGCLKRK